jgi:hypothetical protein
MLGSQRARLEQEVKSLEKDISKMVPLPMILDEACPKRFIRKLHQEDDTQSPYLQCTVRNLHSRANAQIAQRISAMMMASTMLPTGIIFCPLVDASAGSWTRPFAPAKLATLLDL